ncbi:glycogen synthase GlgA [Salinarimonas rosea]|uniref:glycogen synthase GlgA n=1 Tax=Salinarimonas rosea TaxID=552063 RepID=UPI00040BC667|nr:glycogen synthase GlgA [Salinarimonas rosea]
MRVLFVTSELHPLIKTGGLADVSAALPAALAHAGTDVRILMPGYASLMERVGHEGPSLALFEHPALGGVRLATASVPGSGLPLWLVDCPALYGREGGPYRRPDGVEWSDNDLRFGLLGLVAARLARGTHAGWRPDILHVNDWHAGLAPFLLARRPDPRPATIMTIHNLAFHGLCSRERLARLGIDPAALRGEAVEHGGLVSLLKAGLSHADRVTTVSRTYAREIQSEEHGCGLDPLLSRRAEHLIGIPNGADYRIWNPSTDHALPRRYDKAGLLGKRICKQALQHKMGLEVEADTPIIAFMSRLTEQKMADLVAEAVPQIVAAGAQFALCAEGDADLQTRFRALAERYGGRVAVEIGYHEADARRLLAGADMVLHPSRFEPFGLVPIYAMRYGTPPIVRRTGGMADTVVDHDGDPAASTGFSFPGRQLEDLLACVRRALGLYRQPLAWRRLQERAMAQDFCWARPAAAYRAVYDELAAHRRRPCDATPSGTRAEPRAGGRMAGTGPIDHHERIRDHAKEDAMTEDRDSRIRRRAYDLWEEEGRPDGRADEHWAWAEAQLMAEADPTQTTAERREAEPAASDDAAPSGAERPDEAVGQRGFGR